jgi:hypothetical protein
VQNHPLHRHEVGGGCSAESSATDARSVGRLSCRPLRRRERKNPPPARCRRFMDR